ncbi:Ig domain protein group 2 domain protein [Cordyceps fumosorosea ARSEF 2679]|uniref:Ig domain protein group 2 domain protein n=1 Tax=Cordyceps fumosorosea (strain ARSEF 2679) TaxID=1081104 RepID=A0A162LLG3_CORFA|nr:Ig domain protein group 2 domain protein [Cordyceps fumosorosea ARSEF 2679]OAA72354.1 Ig domain protein group 2 domain protein [Cordyceps fumosorosea ARSEF 2679]
MPLSIRLWSALGAIISVTQATQYHIDCSASSGGSGTLTRPWNSLAQANEPTFQPGDIIALKAGSTCNGVLSPKGVGTAQAPIQITKYGGNAGAVINGTGAAGAAVTLTNQDHWRIANLTVTNPARQLAARQGIHVTASDGTTHTGITIDGNVVHHVAGETNKAGSTSAAFILSAGILVDVGTATGSRYDDVLVRGNAVSDCGGGGIKVRVGNAFDNRGARARVTENRIRACGGDGVVLSYGEAPLVDYNVAVDLGKGAYPWTGGNFAGMWVLGGRDPTLRHNVVVGSIMSVIDSEAFDCDWGNAGTCTVEYNFSRDNAGGAFLNCDGCGPSGGDVRQVVRYNVFQNDCRFYSNGDKPTLEFYQNVLYCDKANFNMTLPKNTNFTNNIIVGNGKSSLPARSGISWHENVFQNVKAPTGGGIAGDPRFVKPGSGSDTLGSAAGYRLKSGSPALLSGKVIPDNGGVDFFGNSVSKSSKPNIGAYNGPGL